MRVQIEAEVAGESIVEEEVGRAVGECRGGEEMVRQKSRQVRRKHLERLIELYVRIISAFAFA
jgi:hypothetical protein